ncbi:Fpg/Nei family DNA glycosylase [Salinimicrobium sp. TH3]|uniref:Fpg/Nei family DNA glycosylase n=1 Tax=Salinimicrobium sp. TH3 TaxID=2997342 RepID=UPI00227419FF|nr:DNA-formamidopyrimidine glycosylase family protein [Salinimicrobium sp. TH3]MCY2687393.1 formamidopyrimidine-DNA glycosylase [Salinimicrobium sp. TH3]
MPELPEISLFKDYLNATSLNKKITAIEFLHTGSLQSPKEEFIKAFKGKKFKNGIRLGKYLLIETTGDKALVMHFGMTGKIEYYKNQDPPKYSRVVFSFEDNDHLAYLSQRKLGKLFIAEGLEDFRESQELGKDALELTEKEFLELLEDKTGSIKGVLTDQHVLAGIGNLYSDEMLYQSKIHPKTKTNAISEKDKKQLFKQMKKVLEKAIEKEGVREDFPNSYLIKHRKGGKDCPACKGKIKQIKVSGRSTYFCPSCQKEEK